MLCCQIASVYELQDIGGSSDLIKVLNGWGLEYMLERKECNVSQDS